jgi:hypothetical protein
VFAGENQSKPVIYPKAEALLTRMDEQSRHYRVAISPEKERQSLRLPRSFGQA